MQNWTELPRPILALAPMAGISTSPFRTICRRFGAHVTFTPLLSAEGIIRGQRKSLEMMRIWPDEGPVVVQLFGKNPKSVGVAAKLAQEAGAAGVDLNLGCPAKKIIKQGIGVALAEDLALCHQVLEAICANVTVPVSLKIRAWARCHTREGNVTGPEIVEAMADLPLACITIHGRGTENPFGGPVNLETIAAVRQAFHGLTLANGGIVDGPSAAHALEATDAGGVAVARGCWGKPWIFNEIQAYLEGKPFAAPTVDEVRSTIIEHAQLAEARGGRAAVVEARKHFLWYAKGIPSEASAKEGNVRSKAELRVRLSQASTAADVAAAVGLTA